MTPNQTPGDQTPGDPAQNDPAASDTRLPPESRAARSLTDRSKVEESPVGEPEAPAPERGPRVWPRVVGVLILLVGVGGAWIWQNPGFIQHSLGSLFPGTTNQDTDAAAIQALDSRITRLEQRPAPADLTTLTQRLDTLEKRPPSVGQTSVDLRPLLARLDALEARSGGTQASSDSGPLAARLAALEKTVAERAAKDAALSSQVQELTAHDPATELRDKLDQVEHQLSGLVEGSDHSARLARLGTAEVALASGRPLGAIPDAPPALARFATAAPPTQAALRLRFPAAADAALKVSTPDTEGKSFLDGIVARLQDFRLITVRQGDHVLVGNAASATLAHARLLLDAGDLAGAVREVSTLTGPPAEKMAPWLADASALVAAREALASLAESG